MGNSQEIIDLHAAIISAIETKYPDLITVGDYEDVEEKIETPAVFINLAEFERSDTGNNQDKFFTNCHFEAYICFDELEKNVKINLRQFALELSGFIDKNKWDGKVFNPAKFVLAQPDEFNPKFNAVVVYKIDWEQIISLTK